VIVSTLISKRSQLQTAQLEHELMKSTAALQRIEERLARMEGVSSLSS
jgi:hypothetical protein